MKRKAQSTTTLAVVALIVIIVVAGGAYWWWSQQQKPAPPPEEEAPPPAEEAPPPPPPPEENKPPIVSVFSDKDTADIDEAVTLDAEASSDPDGEIVKYVWDFGDGVIKETSDPSITYAYKSSGMYIVLLTVVDDKDASATNEASLIFLRVKPAAKEESAFSPPTAVLAVSEDVVSPDEEVSFSATSSWAWNSELKPDTGLIVEYQWDFGDGATATGGEVAHSYAKPGNYPVKLTVKAENGKTDTVIHTVHVLEPGIVFVGVKNPDTFVYVTVSETSTLDPAHNHDTYGGQIMQNVYEYLVFYGRDMKRPEPQLAERWEISDDGLTYTFYLRKGVKFHNGDELTAEDVEYTFERLLALASPHGHYRVCRIGRSLTGESTDPEIIDQAVEVVDKYTVRFHLVEPFAPFIFTLADWGQAILNKDWVIEHGGWNPDVPYDPEEWIGKRNPYLDTHAMGTGPFKLVEWVPNQYTLLERFDDYWRGPAKIKRVVIQKVPELSTRMLMLKNGDADAAEIDATYASQVQELEGVTIYSGYTQASTEFIEMNMDIKNIEELPDITISADFFSDPDIRKGFYYAFPFDRYMEEAWLGYGIRAWASVPVGWLGYPEGEPYPYDYDPAKAEEHFRKAWVGKTWEEGFTIPAYYNVGNEPRRIALELLAESLANINPKFKLTIQTLDWPVFLKSIRVGKIPLWASADAINYAEYNAIEMQMASWGAFTKRISYKNDKVDELMLKAAVETDIEERDRIYVEAQKAFMEDPGIIFLAYPLNFQPMRDWVKGYYFNPFFCQGIYFYPLSKG